MCFFFKHHIYRFINNTKPEPLSQININESTQQCQDTCWFTSCRLNQDQMVKQMPQTLLPKNQQNQCVLMPKKTIPRNKVYLFWLMSQIFNEIAMKYLKMIRNSEFFLKWSNNRKKDQVVQWAEWCYKFTTELVLPLSQDMLFYKLLRKYLLVRNPG